MPPGQTKRRPSVAVNKASKRQLVKRKPAAVQRTRITGHDIAVKTVPHFRDFVGQPLPNFRVAIPSHDRSERLCTNTLAMLRRHGIDMKQVFVFISPTATNAAGSPQWYEYIEAFRRHDFLDVHLQPGADGLEGQMNCIMAWAQRGYLVVITDDVLDIRERRVSIINAPARLIPLAAGLLKAVFAHAYALLLAGGFSAWSLNPSRNVDHMADDVISVKLGLVEGNLTGYFLADDAPDYHIGNGMGVVTDLVMTLQMWSSGKRFVRYRSLCVQHRYRGSGGWASVMTKEQRRNAEDEKIRSLERKYPNLVSFCEKPDASLAQQQFKLRNIGDDPLAMRPKAGSGRPRVGFANRPMTAAERQDKYRNGHRRLAASAL